MNISNIYDVAKRAFSNMTLKDITTGVGLLIATAGANNALAEKRDIRNGLHPAGITVVQDLKSPSAVENHVPTVGESLGIFSKGQPFREKLNQYPHVLELFKRCEDEITIPELLKRNNKPNYEEFVKSLPGALEENKKNAGQMVENNSIGFMIGVVDKLFPGEFSIESMFNFSNLKVLEEKLSKTDKDKIENAINKIKCLVSGEDKENPGVMCPEDLEKRRGWKPEKDKNNERKDDEKKDVKPVPAPPPASPQSPSPFRYRQKALAMAR